MNITDIQLTEPFDDSVEDKAQRQQQMLKILIQLFNHTMYLK